MHSTFSPLTHVFIWLAGASAEALLQCPQSEQRKYVAFGATVLVPSLFAILAAGYAVAPLPDRWWIIAGVALLWSFIILTVDRALLATYRAHQSARGKLLQFVLRFGVAVLMGLTISHPLTLLLFKDTIGSITEKTREADVQVARAKFQSDKAGLEARAVALDQQLAVAREKAAATFDVKFRSAADAPPQGAVEGGVAPDKSALDQQMAQAQAPLVTRLQQLDNDIQKTSATASKIQQELNQWQTEFERELDGSRSGKGGVGPRAKSIQDDQLTWRRDENKRLSALLQSQTKEREELRAQSAKLAQSLVADATDSAKSERALQEKMDSLQLGIAERQAGQFVDQQNALRAVLQQQMEGMLTQAKAIRSDLATLDAEGQQRILAILAEPRRDLLHQTSALHRLFDDKAAGGGFAFTTYIVLTLLFLLIDTIPLMVKFTSKAGPYDDFIDQQETESRRRHQAQLQPLQQALADDAEIRRARAALLERDAGEVSAFSDQVRSEQQVIDDLRKSGHGDEADRRGLALDQRAKWFYDSARQTQPLLAAAAVPTAAVLRSEPAQPTLALANPSSMVSPTLVVDAEVEAEVDEQSLDEAEASQRFLAQLKAKEEAFAERLRRERQALAKCSDESEREELAAALEDKVTAFQDELQSAWEEYQQHQGHLM
jgi:Domain of unknown function (DUF4407)